MLSSLLRPKKSRPREQHSPFSSHFDEQSSPVEQRKRRLETRHASADFTETELDDEDTDEENEEDEVGEDEDEGDGVDDDEDNEVDEGQDDEDGHGDTPLLPIFSAAHLGKSH